MSDHILTRNEFSYKFSSKLDKLMRSKRVSNRELAERVGVVTQTIDRYRNGIYIPDAYTIYRIARALPCTIEALIDF